MVAGTESGCRLVPGSCAWVGSWLALKSMSKYCRVCSSFGHLSVLFFVTDKGMSKG